MSFNIDFQDADGTCSGITISRDTIIESIVIGLILSSVIGFVTNQWNHALIYGIGITCGWTFIHSLY